MTICDRVGRECVSLADLDFVEGEFEMNDHAKVLKFISASARRTPLPPLFVIRLDGKLLLHHGLEQIEAAQYLGFDQLDATVFDANTEAECNEIGAVGFLLAENGLDVWTVLGGSHATPRAA